MQRSARGSPQQLHKSGGCPRLQSYAWQLQGPIPGSCIAGVRPLHVPQYPLQHFNAQAHAVRCFSRSVVGVRVVGEINLKHPIPYTLTCSG